MLILRIQHFPKVDGWKVIHNFLQMNFVYKKYGFSIHPFTRWEERQIKWFL